MVPSLLSTTGFSTFEKSVFYPQQKIKGGISVTTNRYQRLCNSWTITYQTYVYIIKCDWVPTNHQPTITYMEVSWKLGCQDHIIQYILVLKPTLRDPSKKIHRNPECDDWSTHRPELTRKAHRIIYPISDILMFNGWNLFKPTSLSGDDWWFQPSFKR